MNTPNSLNTESKNLFNLISKNWEELDDSLKTKLIKIWRVLTYKWQLQILFNLPFLLWWALDKSFPCLLYTSPSPRDGLLSRMPSSA